MDIKSSVEIVDREGCIRARIHLLNNEFFNLDDIKDMKISGMKIRLSRIDVVNHD